MSSTADWSAVEGAVAAAVEAGVFPGAVLLAARGEEVLFHEGFGKLEAEGAGVTTSTVYDVSSLTKPLVTLACLLRFVASGRISLDQPVAELLPEWADAVDPRRATVTIAQLLAHRSGLPARPLYFERIGEAASLDPSDATNRERIVSWATREPLAAAPGTVSLYSDVGFIVLGAVVEKVAGGHLDEVFATEFDEVSPSSSTGFLRVGNSVPEALGKIAPTGFCPWRGRIVCGEVQDENAWAMGGVAGHAGLFATAEGIHRLTLEYVRAYEGADTRLDSESVRRIWSGPFARDSSWALGWDTPTPGASSAGARISARAFGHLGFTGSSVWVDLQRGVQIVLLSNRVHPDPAEVAIREFRPRLHDAVFDTLDGTSSGASGGGRMP